MKLTIIEGPDASGKSQFCHAIAEASDAVYLHFDRPTEPNWVLEYVAPIAAAMQMNPGQDIVCDRHALGELVWPELFGRKSLFSGAWDVQACFRALVALCGEVKLLVFTRDSDDIAATLLERGEQDTTELVLKSKELFLDATWALERFPGFDWKLVESDDVQGDGWKAYI